MDIISSSPESYNSHIRHTKAESATPRKVTVNLLSCTDQQQDVWAAICTLPVHCASIKLILKTSRDELSENQSSVNDCNVHTQALQLSMWRSQSYEATEKLKTPSPQPINSSKRKLQELSPSGRTISSYSNEKKWRIPSKYSREYKIRSIKFLKEGGEHKQEDNWVYNSDNTEKEENNESLAELKSNEDSLTGNI